MMDMTFFMVAGLAVVLVGLSKSGLVLSLGAIGVPLLTLVMPARDAAGMMLPILLVLDAIALFVYRREFDWKLLAILLPGAIVGTIVAWALSAVVDEAAVRLAIGLITVLFVLDAWFPLRKSLENLPPSKPWGSFWGSIAGFTSFVSHTGGPPIQIYLLPLKLRPTLFAGTNAVFFAIVNTLKLLPYFTLGQLSFSNMQTAFYLLPLALAGMGVGVFLVRKIKPDLFYTVTYWLLLALGVKLIYDGVVGIFF